MINYIQGVCNKLSMLHSALAFVSGFLLILAVIVYVINDTIEDQAEQEKLKYAIKGSCAATLYNIILYIFIPTF